MLSLLLLQLLLDPQTPDGRSCFRPTPDGGVEFIGDRRCRRLAPPRRMEGVWLNTFEGSAFYEGATSLSGARGEARVWLRHEEPLIAWKGAPPKQEHAYRVVLIGRSAEDMNRPPLQGYGHMGLWPGLVVVDELLELQDLGPLGPG